MNVIQGDLLAMGKNKDFDIIVQGCNCFNVMGSGIAKQIRAQFEDAWIADQQTLPGDRNKLGHYSIGMSGRLVIINAYTQHKTASFPGEDVFEYNSFQEILNKLAFRFGTYRFGFPMIGMGLAGGNAERILAMLDDFSQNVQIRGGSVTLVEFQSNS